MAENPFSTSPLQLALHRAVDAARDSMEAAGFGVQSLIVIANVSHPAIASVTSAAAHPLDDWNSHVKTMREGVQVFEQAAMRAKT